MKWFIVVSCLALAACEENPNLPARYKDPKHADLVVNVWTAPSDWLTDAATVEACNLWAPEGIVCKKAESKMPIDAFVVIDGSPCQTNAAGASVGTKSEFAFNRITVFENCLVPDQRRDGTLVLAALGHQFGHLFGVVGHVPTECTKETKGLCGLALMNPETTALFAWETAPDDALFQSRTVAGAIGHAPPPPPDGGATTSALTAETPSSPATDVDCALPLPAHAP